MSEVQQYPSSPQGWAPYLRGTPPLLSQRSYLLVTLLSRAEEDVQVKRCARLTARARLAMGRVSYIVVDLAVVHFQR